MGDISSQPPLPLNSAQGSQRRTKVVVATTVLLGFISFWRAAAIVLNDLASSAYYAGGIAEQAAGRSAPWFILGVMLFSYAVRAVYVESCAMFTRGGVYKVVKEAMGGTMAKFSVSALMFDYILTGPISGVTAGQYIVGLTADTLTYFHHPWAPAQSTINHLSAGICVLVTLYFWRRNIRGIHESSDDALRVMKITTVMVILLIGWCSLTLFVQGPKQLPPAPTPDNLAFDAPSVGWLPKLMPHQFKQLPGEPATNLPPNTPVPRDAPLIGLAHAGWSLMGILGLMIAFGHAVLAMSGEESLAQVNRELEHPKHKNLMRAGMVIFVYSLCFTSMVSIFSSMLIPDAERQRYFNNLISGLAMNMYGPESVRLMFQAFVVVVGFLILSGAINTAIVGSNGVLNRLSEDGVLTDWFRMPHKKFGTTHRMINMIAILQVVTIVGSGGDVLTLGNAYAFGVVWSFACNAFSMLVLRYKHKEHREWKVPFNITIRGVELPIGLGGIFIFLFPIAIINLFTKQDATIVGGSFTAIFFTILTISEKITHRQRASHHSMDHFQLNYQESVSQDTIGVRPGNVLVGVRPNDKLDHLRYVLESTSTAERDIVACTVRVVPRGDYTSEMATDQNLFSEEEQMLFSNVVGLAEKAGKTVSLLVAPAADDKEGLMITAQRLQSTTIVIGPSRSGSEHEQSRLAGLAWEKLAEPRPRLYLEMVESNGTVRRTRLGPHAPQLRPEDVETLHRLWLDLTTRSELRQLHHHQILSVALRRFAASLRRPPEAETIYEEFRRMIGKG
jgi:amino acid transporter